MVAQVSRFDASASSRSGGPRSGCGCWSGPLPLDVAAAEGVSSEAHCTRTSATAQPVRAAGALAPSAGTNCAGPWLRVSKARSARDAVRRPVRSSGQSRWSPPGCLLHFRRGDPLGDVSFIPENFDLYACTLELERTAWG